MKTRLRRSLSILLTLLLIISCCGFTAAATTESLGESSVANVFTESNTYTTINAYMNSRKQFFTTSTLNPVTACHPEVAEDEVSHRVLLAQSGITIIDSTFVIDQVWCGEKQTKAQVTETVTYQTTSGTAAETVVHEMYLYANQDHELFVISDMYAEGFSQFQSRSYVPADAIASIKAATRGSVSCIVHVAMGEVGYTETAYNTTKYGPVGEWCAMFVKWCARQSSITEDIFPDSNSCTFIGNFYAQRSRYYSRSNNSGFVPQAGDLFFFVDEEEGGLGHIGIVTGYNDGYFTYVAGNDGPNTDCVYASAMSINDSRLDGYARPAYQASGHSLQCSKLNGYSHMWDCVYCPYYYTANHSLQCAQFTTAKHRWSCSSCDYYYYESHIFVQDGSYQECSYCGYRESLYAK